MIKSGIFAKIHAILVDKHTCENGRVIKDYAVIITAREPDDPQALFAKLLKGAKYVSYFHRYSSDTIGGGGHCAYHVTAEYPSREEQVEEYIYGDQSNDYDE